MSMIPPDPRCVRTAGALTGKKVASGSNAIYLIDSTISCQILSIYNTPLNDHHHCFEVMSPYNPVGFLCQSMHSVCSVLC